MILSENPNPKHTINRTLSSALLCLLGIFIISLILITTMYRYALEEKETSVLHSSERIEVRDSELKRELLLLSSKIDTLIALQEEANKEDERQNQQLLAMNTAFLTWAEAQGLIVRE